MFADILRLARCVVQIALLIVVIMIIREVRDFRLQFSKTWLGSRFFTTEHEEFLKALPQSLPQSLPQPEEAPTENSLYYDYDKAKFVNDDVN